MSESTNRPGLTFPDPWECPSDVAEAVYDVRSYKDTDTTRMFLRKRYGTEDFYMLAVEAVYEVNAWTLNALDKKRFRKIYRETQLPGETWKGNISREHRESLLVPKVWEGKKK